MFDRDSTTAALE